MNGFDFKHEKNLFSGKSLLHLMIIAGISLLITPIFAFGINVIFGIEPEALVGFYVMACVPTTLSSGIVISGLAGGCKSTAVILTILMSFIGVFTLPLILEVLMASSEIAQIQPWFIFGNLCLCVLIPFLFGIFLKRYSSKPFTFGSYYPSSIVILIVFTSTCVSGEVLLGTHLHEFIKWLCLSVLIHGIMLITIGLYLKFTDLKENKKLSLLICGSQKTLPLSLGVMSMMGMLYPKAIVFCLMIHFVQLFIDSYLSSKLYKTLP